MVPVGQLTTSGRRDDSVASAAIEIGRATSTTASRARRIAERPGEARLVAQQRRQRPERRRRTSCIAARIRSLVRCTSASTLADDFGVR